MDGNERLHRALLGLSEPTRAGGRGPVESVYNHDHAESYQGWSVCERAIGKSPFCGHHLKRGCAHTRTRVCAGLHAFVCVCVCV